MVATLPSPSSKSPADLFGCKQAQLDLSFMVLHQQITVNLYSAHFTILNVRSINLKITDFYAGASLPGLRLFGCTFFNDGQWRRAHSCFQRVLRQPNLQVLKIIVINLLRILQTLWLWFVGSWIGRVWKEDDGGKQTKLLLWRILVLLIGQKFSLIDEIIWLNHFDAVLLLGGRSCIHNQRIPQPKDALNNFLVL